jgi:molecular chaperone HtpG
VVAGEQPRRSCEEQYLARYCRVQTIDDAPKVLRHKPPSTWTIEEQAIAFRIAAVLASDYFFPAVVDLGELSHALPIVVEAAGEATKIVLDPTAPTFGLIAGLYATDAQAFGSMVKDFVRNMVFPRVADKVPSSTRQGAEAFLKTIRRTRDVFEYELDDLGSLSAIWTEYLEGRLSMTEAAERSTSIVERSVQFVDSSATLAVRDVVPDVVANEEVVGSPDPELPAPPILRSELSSTAKLLTIPPSEAPLRGHRCFIALSERSRDEHGEFFLQPHSTSIVWGGQKVLFVFEHHSARFGFYYDLQTTRVVADESGGGRFPTATIVLSDRIYIPIPEPVAAAFIPAPGERKRFEVRCDLLYSDLA